jgi:hypothetical protein
MRRQRREYGSMGLLWGIFKAIVLFFSVVIAALVVIDGTLFANLFKKSG